MGFGTQIQARPSVPPPGTETGNSQVKPGAPDPQEDSADDDSDENPDDGDEKARELPNIQVTPHGSEQEEESSQEEEEFQTPGADRTVSSIPGPPLSPGNILDNIDFLEFPVASTTPV